MQSDLKKRLTMLTRNMRRGSGIKPKTPLTQDYDLGDHETYDRSAAPAAESTLHDEGVERNAWAMIAMHTLHDRHNSDDRGR